MFDFVHFILIQGSFSYNLHVLYNIIIMPPLKKEGHFVLHLSVGMSVGRYVGIN